MKSPTAVILELIKQDALGTRNAFADNTVLKALESIGVVGGSALGIQVRRLHAPHPNARSTTGIGKSLCGEKRGTRHSAGVTCKDCLKRMESS